MLTPDHTSPCTKGVRQDEYLKCLSGLLESIGERKIWYFRNDRMKSALRTVYKLRNFDQLKLEVLSWRYHETSPLFILGATRDGELVISKLYSNEGRCIQSYYHVTYHKFVTHLSTGDQSLQRYVIDCNQSQPVITLNDQKVSPTSLTYYLQDKVSDVEDLLELVNLVNNSSCFLTHSPRQVTSFGIKQPRPVPMRKR